jgi:hypothetical protein
MQRRSVKQMMSFATSRRTRGLLAQVCGMVTVLALVVAPACAPLCAAKVCSQALSSAEEGSPCHAMAMGHGSAISARTAQTCGTLELPEAALNSTNKNERQHNNRFGTFSAGLDIPVQEISSAPMQLRDYCFACTSSPHTSSSLFLTSILRI